jgi:hypothetical protein
MKKGVEMLNSHDLEILSGMVKSELEKLIVKRTIDSTPELDKNLLSEEINQLYTFSKINNSIPRKH